MTKKDLEARIVALEAQVAVLQGQIAARPYMAPYVYPSTPFAGTWPTITCDATMTTNPRGSFRVIEGSAS